jgi:gamma-glutamyltranspeptidase/glutathione hydrolase
MDDAARFGADLEQGPKPPVQGEKAMASASHPRVSAAMADVMKRGGNAMDAVLTAVLLQGVVEPQMTTLAGGLSILYYDAATRTSSYIDAELDHTRIDPPVAASWDHYLSVEAALGESSGRRVGVPGIVAGVYEASRKFGSLDWADYFGPAIDAAAEGFPMYSFLYGEAVDAATSRLSAFASGRAEFLPEGFVPPVGELVLRPELAETLRRIAADGPDHVYRGAWGAKFVRMVGETRGSITERDLDDYAVRTLEPLSWTFRGHELISAPPPSTGGVMIALVLNILEHFDLQELGHYTENVEALEVFRRTFAFAEYFTEGFVKDPLSHEVPLGTLMSKDFAGSLATLIKLGRRAGGQPVGTESPFLVPGGKGPKRRDPHDTDTDHVVAVDADGNMASMTHTIYGTTFGTGLVVDGIHVNSGNSFPGTGSGDGRRVISPFPPTMIAKDGVPWLSLGSPGLAARAVAIVLANYLGYEMDLQAAIDAPRFQGVQVDQPFVIESRIDDRILAELAENYGADVRRTLPFFWHFGSLHAVERRPDGTTVGYRDPRRPGRAEGF